MVVVKREENPTFENKLEKLKDEFDDLKLEISDLRKKGKDTTFAEVFCLDFNPKYRMAKATYDNKDLERITRLIKDIRREIKDARDGTSFSRAHALVERAYDNLREGDKGSAREDYAKIVRIYPELQKDLKKSIYKACLDIREKVR